MRRYAIVTGSTRGIGAAIVDRLLERDTTVLGVARSAATIQHRRYRHVRLDLTCLDQVEAFFKWRFAGAIAPIVDADEVVLVNNGASIGSIEPLEDQSLSDLEQTLTLNALVPIWLMGFIPRCFPGHPVRTINLSSGAAQRAYAGWIGYCSSKSSLLMASRVYAEEQSAPCARPARPPRSVTCLAPGSVDTDIQSTIRGADRRHFPDLEKFHRLKRSRSLFSPAEIGDVVARLIDTTQAPGFQNLRYVEHDRLMCLECGGRFGAAQPHHQCAPAKPAPRPARQVDAMWVQTA